MKALRLIIKYWKQVVPVLKRLDEEKETLARVRVDPLISLGLTNLVIDIAKAKADGKIDNPEKSVLMTRYWAVLDYIEVEKPKTAGDILDAKK